jgi:hypothetical protein
MKRTRRGAGMLRMSRNADAPALMAEEAVAQVILVKAV